MLSQRFKLLNCCAADNKAWPSGIKTPLTSRSDTIEKKSKFQDQVIILGNYHQKSLQIKRNIKQLYSKQLRPKAYQLYLVQM